MAEVTYAKYKDHNSPEIVHDGDYWSTVHKFDFSFNRILLKVILDIFYNIMFLPFLFKIFF